MTDGKSSSLRWERAKVLSLWVVIILLAVNLGAITGVALTPASQTIVQPGSMVSDASYIVFVDSAKNYFALNGTTGAIDSSGTVASIVIQYAFDHTVAQGVVYIKAGFYEVTTTLTVQNAITIRGDGLDATARAGGTVLGCHGAAFGPILNVTTQNYWFAWFSLRDFTVISCSTKDGISLYSGSAGVLGYGHLEDVRVYSNGISGTPAGFLLYGVISTTFINVMSDYEYYGFRLNSSGTPAQSNFNKFIGGRTYNDQYGFLIDGQSSNNIIQGVDIGSPWIGIFLRNANQTMIVGNWFESVTSTVIFILYPTTSTVIMENKINQAGGVTGIWDNGLRTRATANQFSGPGTKVGFGSTFLGGYYSDNILYNPFGNIANPIDATHATIGACATTCSGTVVSWTNYTVQGYDLYVHVASSTFNVYSPAGTLVASALTSYFVPFGYHIAFNGVPTIGVFGA